MANAKTVQAELSKATGVKPVRGKSVKIYLKKLARAVAKLDEDDWDELSEEAQEWYNQAAAALNDGGPIPSIQDALASMAEDDEDEEDEDEDLEDDEDEEDEDEDLEDDEDDEDDEDEDEDLDDDEDEEDEEEGDADDWERQPPSRAKRKLAKDEYVNVVTKDGEEVEGTVVSVAKASFTVEDGDGEKVRVRFDTLKEVYFWIGKDEGEDDEAEEDEDEDLDGEVGEDDEDEEDDDEDLEDDEEDEDEDEEPAPKKRSRGRSSKRTASSSAKPRSRSRSRGTASSEPKPGDLVIDMMVRHPTWSRDRIEKALAKKKVDIKPSTLRLVYGSTKKVLDKVAEING